MYYLVEIRFLPVLEQMYLNSQCSGQFVVIDQAGLGFKNTYTCVHTHMDTKQVGCFLVFLLFHFFPFRPEAQIPSAVWTVVDLPAEVTSAWAWNLFLETSEGHVHLPKV